MGKLKQPVTDPFQAISSLEQKVKELQRGNPLQYSATADDAGTIRFEAGALPARGISPGGQFGHRAWDASGNLLYDPNTLSNMGRSLGISAAGPGQDITSSSYVTTSPVISISFTIDYPTRIRFRGFVCGKQRAQGFVGYARINLVGVGTTGDVKFGGGTTANHDMDVTCTEFSLLCTPGSTVGTLAAGSYTARLEVRTDAAGTYYVDEGYIEGEIISPAAF